MSYISDLLYSVASCLTCFQSPTLRVNGRNLKILKLLGEGGFSYVYLVQDSRTDQLYALKKIRCPFGQESVQAALREVDAYKLFKSESIIRAVDSAVIQESDGSRTVYILLPYFDRGNLQDRINDHLIGNTHWDERDIVRLVVDIAKGLAIMHNHHVDGSAAVNSMDDLYNIHRGDRQSTEVDSSFIVGDDDDDGEASSSDPSHEETRLLTDNGDTPMGQIVAYAHRDIKPANIMINDKGRPVLMDLGSCSPARVNLRTRQEALVLQDLAAEHCTLPYRAPELFDVKTGSSVDERVDIWSLGCTIFALMYCSSPFEMQAAETGASLNMAIVNGQYKFPASPEYSDGLKKLVSSCMTVDREKRPFVSETLRQAEALAEL